MTWDCRAALAITCEELSLRRSVSSSPQPPPKEGELKLRVSLFAALRSRGRVCCVILPPAPSEGGGLPCFVGEELLLLGSVSSSPQPPPKEGELKLRFHCLLRCAREDVFAVPSSPRPPPKEGELPLLRW